MKKISIVSLLLFFSFAFSACSQNNTSDNYLDINQPLSDNTTQNTQPSPSSNLPADNATGESMAAIKLSNGQIVIKLYSDKAPNTVKNFINKANSDFYNGLTFHRVEPGFVVQGGDPKGNGTGGGTIASELSSTPFVKGSVGLARGPANKNISNDSQFFICLTTEACQHLTGDYVNFGHVVSGFEYAQLIKVGDKIIEITTDTK